MTTLECKPEFFSAYERQRYLDAYGLCAPYLKPERVHEFDDADDCIQLSRLSLRLGGIQLSRDFIERALEIDSGSPEVRYYSLCMGPAVSSLLGIPAIVTIMILAGLLRTCLAGF